MKFGQVLALGSFMVAAAVYVRDGSTFGFAVWFVGGMAQAVLAEVVASSKRKEPA